MISAYIMPHPPIARHGVGRGEEKIIQNTLDAYRAASELIAQDAPETIVIISPHNVVFRDAFYLSPGKTYEDGLYRFGDSEDRLSIPYDTELADEIAKLAEESDIPVVRDDVYAKEPDHGSAVPLLFVRESYTNFRVVRIAPCFLSNQTLRQMGKIIERAAAHVGRRMTLIASGDLSHKLREDGPYGFAKEGPEFDKQVTAAMKTADFDAFTRFDAAFIDKAAQCGLPGFMMMAGALENYHVTPNFLSYEGPFGVGYAVCAYAARDVCVQLAKDSLECYVRTGKQLQRPDGLPSWMTEKRSGVFVSLHKAGDLRGCIGTIRPWTDCIADEIIALAVEAGTQDPRFCAVSESELPDLIYNVDILSDAEPAERSQLDAKRYGVIVTCGGRRGLLLPDLEGVDTPGQQIDIALRKAGIAPNENYSLERFTVERHT